MKEIKLEILNTSYNEHFRRARDLHDVGIPVEDPRRKRIETALKEISEKLNLLRDKG